MREDGRISLWQFLMLAIGFLIGTSTLIAPIGPARQDAWLAYLLAGILGIGAVWLYTSLGRRFPQETPLQYTPRILGPWLGNFFNIIFLWYTLHLGTVVLRNINELYRLVIMPKTPMLVLAAIFMGLAAWGVRLGVEILGRLAETLVPFIISGIAILTFLTFITPELVHWDNLLPFMEHGPIPILSGSYDAFVFPFGETVALLAFIPFLTKPEKCFRPFVLAVILVALGTSLVVLRNTVVLGAFEADRMAFPSLVAIQQINIADFLTRLEAIIIFVWTFSVFLKLAIIFYVFVLGIAQVFRFEDYRFLALPAAVFVTFFSLAVFENISQMFQFATRVASFYLLPYVLFYPLTLLIVAKVRNIKG